MKGLNPSRPGSDPEKSAAANSILLHEKDNVLVCTRAIKSGDMIRYGMGEMVARDDIMVGHKIALQDLPQGTKVFRYGAPIGSVSRNIEKGAHVHTHNLKSDYIDIHNRQGTNNT